MVNNSRTNVAVIVLAAGASSRLGQSKQLLQYQGESLVRRAARTAVESLLGPVIVIIARGDDATRQQLDGLSVTIIENADPARGMGSSIKAALQAIDAAADAVLITVCDQPAVTPDLLRSLAALRRDQNRLAACAYGGTIGVPAVFSRELFGELRNIPDDAGAKMILQNHRGCLATIDFPAGADDIDTAADLKNLL